MGQVKEIMKVHSEFCNIETRVPDIKYIIKKYNFEEIVIVDSDRHPLGIVKADSVSDEAMKNIVHPFDGKAGNLMKSISITVSINEQLEECLNLMEVKHLSVIPVTDEEGHCVGIVKKEDLIKHSIH